MASPADATSKVAIEDSNAGAREGGEAGAREGEERSIESHQTASGQARRDMAAVLGRHEMQSTMDDMSRIEQVGRQPTHPQFIQLCPVLPRLQR